MAPSQRPPSVAVPSTRHRVHSQQEGFRTSMFVSPSVRMSRGRHLHVQEVVPDSQATSDTEEETEYVTET